MTQAQPDEQQGLRTLARGLAVLEAVVEADGTATAKLLTHRLGLRQSTTYQLLKTLINAGYVVRTPSGVYEVGPSVPAMFRRLQTSLAPDPRVMRALRALRDMTEQTAYACALHGTSIVLQQVMEGKGALVVRMLEPGFRSNVHARASCRAILAHLPEDERRRILPTRVLPKLTPNTITSRSALRRELALICDRGYAIEHAEFAESIGCVAAPFFGGTGRVAGSLTVAMPLSTLDAAEESTARAVMQCARAASTGGAE